MVYWAGAALITSERHFSPQPRAPTRGCRGLSREDNRGGRGSARSLPGWTHLGLRGLLSLPLTWEAVLCPGHQTPRGRHKRSGVQDFPPHLEPLKGSGKGCRVERGLSQDPSQDQWSRPTGFDLPRKPLVNYIVHNISGVCDTPEAQDKSALVHHPKAQGWNLLPTPNIVPLNASWTPRNSLIQ